VKDDVGTSAVRAFEELDERHPGVLVEHAVDAVEYDRQPAVRGCLRPTVH